VLDEQPSLQSNGTVRLWACRIPLRFPYLPTSFRLFARYGTCVSYSELNLTPVDPDFTTYLAMVKYTLSSSFLPALSLVFVAQCASIASNATCYFPDGSVHKLGSPCRPAAGDGACCEATHACLSNGLCFEYVNPCVHLLP
jgi:hypothetical protein